MTAFAPQQYTELLLFLATAGIVVPLFRRLHLSPILGFLAAGAALGPYGLGAVALEHPFLLHFTFGNQEEEREIAGFGVVFLLFMMGLELSWERLARMRRLVFGLGAVQVFGSSIAMTGLALALGTGPRAALILGFALSLSSTAIVIPVLAERKRLATTTGRSIFSVLLFQDLMVAPLLFMVSALGTQSGTLAAFLTSLPQALAGLILIFLLGRVIIRPIFHQVAAARSNELFMAACFFVILSTSLLAEASGISMGIGALIAGLLLAETEYRREIEVTIEPFKGLFLGLFFVSIGAGLDLNQVLARPLLTIGVALGLVAVKFCAAFLAASVFNLKRPVAFEAALMLAPGGEFAFVMLNAAILAKALAPGLGANAEFAVTISMFMIPAFGALAARLSQQSPPDGEDLAAPPEASGTSNPKIIIIGFGRVGRLTGEMLTLHKIPFLAVDSNPAVVRAGRKEGLNLIWGSAERLDFLQRCGLNEAQALVVTTDTGKAAEDIISLARTERPDITIVARARDAKHAKHLYKLGVTDAVPETIEASLQLSEAVLVGIGIPMGYVIASIHEKRDEFRKILQPAEGNSARPRHAIKMSTRVKEKRK